MISAKELGERKIIKLLIDCLDQMPNMPLSFGDDASAIELENNNVVVLNVDMLVRKTDVPKRMSLWQAARKAIIMNISDLAAKGARPLGILASLGIPSDLTKNEIEQIGKGLNAGAREYNIYVLGGDTNESSELIISCTALGIINKKNLIKRSGAKPGDYVAVTGSFGKTTSGLKILMNNLPDSNSSNILISSVLMPNARVKEGIALAQSQAVTASIDSSDGLAWSIHELSIASKVGFRIDNLPIAPEAKKFANTHGLDSVELAMYGGEEYELLVTVDPNLWNIAVKAVESIGETLTKIGEVTKKKGLLLNINKRSIPIEARGYEHFKTN